ncbi:response regulator transcription factor [soil metagenome]
MLHAYRILIASANEDIRKVVCFSLKDNCTLYKVVDAQKIMGIVKKIDPHLVIIQDDDPFFDVIKICALVKSTKSLRHSRILALSSNSDESFQVAVIEAGADDILSLPVSPHILFSKVNMLLRRKEVKNERQDLIFKQLIISPGKYAVTVVGQGEYTLPRKEFELLYVLAEVPGKVFSRAEIMEIVWEPGVQVGNRTVDVHIRKIRKGLNICCIHTVNGRGYRFIPR